MQYGAPYGDAAVRLMLLGSGELGKEVAIEAQRLGVEVIAVDKYAHAPAMQIAHRSHVIDMMDGRALRALVEQEHPTWIVPEVEAIATDTLIAMEAEGWHVVPTAKATRLTMDREGIRCLAAETLGLRTSPYRFADDMDALKTAVMQVGMPCVIKPVMSSSGKGQSVIRSMADIEPAWQYAQEGGRAGAGRVIVEGFVDFEFEITLLTVRHQDGTLCCPPIGHRQEDGDYCESWQPQPMSLAAQCSAEAMAIKVTDALGGYGVFGVEFFVRDDTVWFSEVSPRPHDTGLVTLASQGLSEFELHVRAILGLPIPTLEPLRPAASVALLAEGHGRPVVSGMQAALSQAGSHLRLFGKPNVQGRRRMGVIVCSGDDVPDAFDKAKRAAQHIQFHFD